MKVIPVLKGALLGVAAASAIEVIMESKEEPRFLSSDPQSPNVLNKATNFLGLKSGLGDKEQNLVEDDYDQNTRETIDKSVLEPSSSDAENRIEKTPPALSALALLGFLYFLNLIEDVLQGTSGRRKRDVGETDSLSKGVETYLTSIENFVDSVSDYVPAPTKGKKKETRSLKENPDSKTERVSGRSFEERADKIMSFFGYVWSSVLELFGVGKKAASRQDESSDVSVARPGIWSVLGSKIGQIATLTDFLSDPQPSRIGRLFKEPETDDLEDDKAEIAEPAELSPEDRNFLPPEEAEGGRYEAEDVVSRRKRFTDGMNAWYSHIGENGRTASPDSTTTDGAGQLFGLVFNMLRGALTENI